MDQELAQSPAHEPRVGLEVGKAGLWIESGELFQKPGSLSAGPGEGGVDQAEHGREGLGLMQLEQPAARLSTNGARSQQIEELLILLGRPIDGEQALQSGETAEDGLLALCGRWPGFPLGQGRCERREEEGEGDQGQGGDEETRAESSHSDLLRAARLRPAWPKRRASQKEVCGHPHPRLKLVGPIPRYGGRLPTWNRAEPWGRTRSYAGRSCGLPALLYSLNCPPERGMAEGATGPLGGRGLTIRGRDSG